MEAADTRLGSTRRQHRTMRTESPNDGDTDFLRSSGALPRENERRKPKKPLDFYQAMSDFKKMFPHIDKDVIEAVLRANDGVVQTTIDQLLVLSETTDNEENATDGSRLPNYHESQACEHDLPPSYDEVESEILDQFARESREFECRREDVLSPVVVDDNNSVHRTELWNPPLVGELPSDFLRIVDDITLDRLEHDGPPLPSRSAEQSRDGFISDKDLEQFLEDEKLAMFLQNEEFMRQLRHDPDFLMSLEEDHRRFMQSQDSASGAASSSAASIELSPRSVVVHPGGARPRNSTTQIDDAVFNRKLKHMGKTTRKKFGKLAKRFSRKKNTKFVPLGASTMHLLDEDFDDGVDQSQLNIIDEQEHAEDTNDEFQIPEGKGTTGRKLPQPPAQRSPQNAEPIVFYSEDNEFEYKAD